MTMIVGAPSLSKAVGYSKSMEYESRREQIVTLPITYNSTTPVFGVQAFVTSLDGKICNDTAPLKWSGVEAFERCILGGQTVSLDVCGVSADGIFLHTDADLIPEKPIETSGTCLISGVVVVPGDTSVYSFSVTISLPSVT